MGKGIANLLDKKNIPMVYLNMHSDELRAWRKSQGFTQTELGDILGVKKTTVYRWEKNMRIIPPFLHLALECIEMKGDEYKIMGMKTKKKKGV